jgi:hypothetical protein
MKHYFVLLIVLLTGLSGCYETRPANSSASSPAPSSSSSPKYTLMNRMNALEFAISVTNYEDAATKISEYSLSAAQIREANYIKGIASQNKEFLVLGLLSDGTQVLAWTDGNNGSEFYFQQK